MTRSIFHKAKCDLQKWFGAIEYFYASAKSVTVRELAAQINVTNNTAWKMLVKMQTASKESEQLFEHILELAHEHTSRIKKHEPHE